MQFYRKLYISESLEKKKEKIMRRLKTGKLQINVYIIALPSNERNQLEIYNSSLLMQPSFPKDNLFVAGIAKGYEEALELVEEITKEVYNETGGANIRAYIMGKEQEG